MKLADVKNEISSLLKQTDKLMQLPHHSPQKRNYLLGKKHTLTHLNELFEKIEKRQSTEETVN